MKRPVPVTTGLRLTRTGNVLPSRRCPASRTRDPIGRATGSRAYPARSVTCAVRKLSRDQRLDRLADQLTGPAAEHVLRPPVGQHQHAILVGEYHPVSQRIDQPPQRRRADPRPGPVQRHMPAARARLALALARTWPWQQRDDTWRPGGDGRLHRRVDRNQPIQSTGRQHLADSRGGDSHPQLGAAVRCALAGAHQSSRARTVARQRPGHVRDQHVGTPVEQFQQLLADGAGNGRADVLRQCHHRLASRPPHRARAVRHGRRPARSPRPARGLTGAPVSRKRD